MMNQSYKIVNIGGHVEIYDEKGCFLFSADTRAEAEENIELLSA